MALSAKASVTVTATFDNFTAGQSFRPTFTDPLSGITFLNSTHPPLPGNFEIDGDPGGAFSGTNYLTAGGGPNDAFGPGFGFTANLPTQSSQIALTVIYLADSRSNVVLRGFDSGGNLVAWQSGPAGLSTSPFELQIVSSQFNITSFQVSVSQGGAGGYDNIGYTAVPEPASIAMVVLPSAYGLMKRKKLTTGG